METVHELWLICSIDVMKLLKKSYEVDLNTLTWKELQDE